MCLLTFDFEDDPVSQRDCYARISTQIYRIHGEASERELLTELLAVPEYTGESLRYDVDWDGTHGPFRQSSLSADSYLPCNKTEAITALEAWLGDPRPAAPDEMTTLSGRVAPLLEGSVFRLQADPDESLSIGATWLEFVAIDRTSARLSVVIAWDD